MVWESVSQTRLNFSNQFLSKREALYQFSLKFGLRFLSFRDQCLSCIKLTYTEEDKNYVHVEQKNFINVCDILQYFVYLALARCITLTGVLYVQCMAAHLQWDYLFYFVSMVRFSYIIIVLNRSRFKLM